MEQMEQCTKIHFWILRVWSSRNNLKVFKSKTYLETFMSRISIEVSLWVHLPYLLTDAVKRKYRFDLRRSRSDAK